MSDLERNATNFYKQYVARLTQNAQLCAEGRRQG